MILGTAAGYFKHYPTVQSLYLTADLMVFLPNQKHQADNHARSLGKGGAVKVTRADADNHVNGAANTGKKGGTGKEAQKGEKDAAAKG